MKYFKLIITVNIFLLFLNNISSQDTDLFLLFDLEIDHLECATSYSQKEIIKQLKTSFEDNVLFVEDSEVNIMAINTSIISSKFLEGMDSYYFSEVETTIKLVSKISELEKSIVVKSEGKGKTECNSLNKAFSKSFKGKNKAKVIELLSSYNKESATTFCSSINAKSNDLFKNRKFIEALTLLNTIPEEQNCSSELINLRESIEESIAKENCDTELYELQLIVNTGDTYLIKKNIYRLLRISPNAPCANEAITLSKQIGEILKIANSNSKDLQKFNLYIENNNNDSWRKQYIRSYN